MKGLTMSRAEAEAHQKKHGFMKGGDASCTNLPSIGNAALTFKPKRAAKQPNKTEKEFEGYVQALRGLALEFEPVKLRIGPNCYYTPDWGDLEGRLHATPTFFECKGAHIWDDSLVKFKAAKERHSWAAFELWQKKQGEWRRLL